MRLTNLSLAFFAMLLVSALSVAESKAHSNLADAFAADTQTHARNILESLELNHTQKSEIQSILLAAMQSMDAVNEQLEQLQSDEQRLLSKDIQEMISALHKQRVQLAEMLSVEILSVLSPQQRSKLNLMPDVEKVNEPTPQNNVREYEI